ncbi:MAG TPA: fused MFS/spermidine synthase [Bacteroidales bacterium]|nr:fused MFS/spermidine synthase [Bacteroidales bacterium]HPS16231.1 fused MFS/spermidine synthase [Bacteroidales bacterium]
MKSIKVNKEMVFIYGIIALGISSVVTQIIFIREFLNVFYGNELIFGIIMASWMLLTAIGAMLGKSSERIHKKEGFLIGFQLLSAIFPLLSIFLLRWLRNIIFPEGIMLSPMDGIMVSFTFLLPYCIVSGYLFTFFSITLSEKIKSNQISRVYYFDTLGSIIGGIVFNFFLVYFLNNLQVLYVLLIVNLTAAFAISLTFRKKRSTITLAIVTLAFLFLMFNYNLEKYTREKQYKNQELIYSNDTPFGNLVVTKTGNQLNFFENSMLLFSTDNYTENEEAVHYAMLQHQNPKKILLVSGGVNGLANEILKYNIDSIDYLEINPALVELGKKYTHNLESPKIHIKNEDARLFLKQTKEKFDVVIIELPAPNTAQLNRYYTLEFFKELKLKLNKDGVISFGLYSGSDYISPEIKNINSVLFNTLNKVFKNILIIPGNKNFFIASDGKLNPNITELVTQKGIDNLYVNPYYLDDNLIKDRMQYILRHIDKKTVVNKDFYPIVYFHQLRYWMSHFKSNYYYLLAVIMLITLILILRLKPVKLCLFTGGFASSSMEVVILVAFQIIYGYVYQVVGIIITLFMAGLAFGTYYVNKKIKNQSVNNFLKVQAAIAIYCFVLPLFILISAKLSSSFYVELFFIFLILILGILTGMSFSLASKTINKSIHHIAAEIYGADLFGSAIGALILSTFLLPLLGIFEACILTGFLNVLSGINLYFKRKNYSV